jgi:quercetin dioxygenase-like cupin family protein
MPEPQLGRRPFLSSLIGAPAGLMLSSQTGAPGSPVAKIAAGAGRGGEVIKLPGGDLVYIKVTGADTGGGLFLTEQPIDRRGTGPPKHYHEEQDEWFYCVAGEYVVEIGDQRVRLTPGESILGPRRVPHAFVYDAPGTGHLLVGFTPAGRMEAFFRDLEKRGRYFGNGTAEDRETARREYGIVNVGPPLTL